MRRLIIIDGNAIVHRAYHALPPLTTKNGKMVNAAYGFTSMLLKVWNDLKPTHIAVTFDVAGGNFRHVKYEKYKATRVKADQELYDQIPVVHDVVSAFNLPIYEMKGFEADDVIGTIVDNCHIDDKKAKKTGITEDPDLETFIVTGDMDTLQLIRPGVKVYTLRKGMSDVVIYDAPAVEDRYGFGPEMMVDYKALRGDTSDNIPGVPGIGEKTATELIQKVGGIEKIYQALKNGQLEELGFKPGVIKKLTEGEESAKMSFELATIHCVVPDLKFSLDKCEIKEFDREKIVKLFQELEFVSLLKRVPGGNFTQEEQTRKTSTVKTRKHKPLEVTEVKYANTSEKIFNLIEENKLFSCKILTKGTDIFTAEIIGAFFIIQEKAFWVPVEFMEDLWKVFGNKNCEIIGHDLKQMIKILKARGVEVNNRLFDVMIASYLTNSGSRAHGVQDIILKVLGKELKVGSQQNSLFGVDVQAQADELYLLQQASEVLRGELAESACVGLMEKIEMPLTHVLAEMEYNGVAVDLEMLGKLSKDAAKEIKKVSDEIYELAGMEFNISSPVQLREVLFDKLQIPVEGIKMGKTGLSTSAEQLEKMHGLHPIIEKIEIHRELAKLQNTYIDVLPTLINKKTGRIHTTFNQAVTATGRLSSSDPNLQNIPIRTELGREIRKTFIAEKGFELISADYSQIELRIVASLAEDKRLMEIFDKGEDVHKATAAAINGVPLDKVTKEMRRAAKEVNFGVLYGMGAFGLAWRADIPREQARDFIKKYFEEFSGVKKYIDQTLEFTRKEGYCETLFGRRRYIPELNSKNHQLRAAAERMAINHPVQGTAADLIKMAMIKIHDELKKHFPENGDVRMTLQVHDELVFEVKNGLEEKVSKIIEEAMENVVKLRVPIKVDVHVGKRWGEMK